jgi:hypothetical protein
LIFNPLSPLNMFSPGGISPRLKLLVFSSLSSSCSSLWWLFWTNQLVLRISLCTSLESSSPPILLISPRFSARNLVMALSG